MPSWRHRAQLCRRVVGAMMTDVCIAILWSDFPSPVAISNVEMGMNTVALIRAMGLMVQPPPPTTVIHAAVLVAIVVCSPQKMGAELRSLFFAFPFAFGEKYS